MLVVEDDRVNQRVIELMLALNFRSLRYSLLEAPPHKWLLIAIAWELALLVVLIQFEPVREAFGITLPSWSDVGFVLITGAGVMATIELAKWLLRRRADSCNRFPASSTASTA